MIRSRRWIPLAVGVVAVLGGCTTQVAGAPVPVPDPTFQPSPTAEPTAENLLGDLASLDPCGLIDPADLAPVGTAALDTPRSLDYCALTLTTPGGAKLELSVGMLTRLDSEDELVADYREYGDLRIAAETGGATWCTHHVVFTGLVALSASVDNYTDGRATPAEMCGVADHAARAVADRLAKGEEVEHRTLPVDSLGRLDACAAVVGVTVAKVPGLEKAEIERYPAGHQCRWSRDGGADPPRLRVTYTVGVPTAADGRHTAIEEVSGRRTAVSRSSTASAALCAAETAHIAFDGGEGLRELAVVVVTLPQGDQIDQACTAAKAVAAEVWPRLPR
ncbi:DUF3558 family protein [Saccharothrix algeriensis]|uniref:DUF3558 domain-containing protein n=1 Tax=Saccharothrix algeriensis TaxID=173560 RepID=A0A8T8HYN9_9PSEU|nr:DUF3558 family protein [Saccharothrix algeriensis]MBM7809320.1 hypothetical protein [Saccharothrix algeriensis]QTR03662.1 hypothetical protein J7S33_00980 [Saccharothrix algeriensis]